LTGGLLRDLGSHLVAQMLYLLGPVLSRRRTIGHGRATAGATDAGFVLTLRHASGVHSHLSASKLNHLAEKEYRAYGEVGCYVSSGTDAQAQAIFSGRRPTDNLEHWGYEDGALWGALHTASGVERVASEQGRYHDYSRGSPGPSLRASRRQ
jgi:predicted dehydrogenase